MTDTFTITRTLAAPRELVYETITTPEHFGVWFGTAAVEVPQSTLSMDVRVGGRWKADMHLPGGQVIHWAGEYVELDPPARVVLTMTDAPDQYDGAPVSFDLVEVESGTQLTITQQRGDFGDEQVQATIAGYNAFVDSMAEILERLQA